MRADLGVPQQLVQAGHAALESGIHLAHTTERISSLVVCSVANEEALLKALDRIRFRGINVVLFREPDMNDEATALATEPLSGLARKVCSKYPLWEGKVNNE